MEKIDVIYESDYNSSRQLLPQGFMLLENLNTANKLGFSIERASLISVKTSAFSAN